MMTWLKQFQHPFPISKRDILVRLTPLMKADEARRWYRGFRRAAIHGGPVISGFDPIYDDGLGNGMHFHTDPSSFKQILENQTARQEFFEKRRTEQ